jgi:hypothetical protein
VPASKLCRNSHAAGILPVAPLPLQPTHSAQVNTPLATVSTGSTRVPTTTPAVPPPAILPPGLRANPFKGLEFERFKLDGLRAEKSFNAHSLGIAHLTVHPCKPVVVRDTLGWAHIMGHLGILGCPGAPQNAQMPSNPDTRRVLCMQSTVYTVHTDVHPSTARQQARKYLRFVFVPFFSSQGA